MSSDKVKARARSRTPVTKDNEQTVQGSRSSPSQTARMDPRSSPSQTARKEPGVGREQKPSQEQGKGGKRPGLIDKSDFLTMFS